MKYLEHKKTRHKSKHGFTLLELTIVFGIIGLLSVIGFSSFTSYSRKQVLDQGATQVRSALEVARFNALSKVKPQICDDRYPLSGYEFMLCDGSDPTCAGDYEVRAQCTPAPGETSTTITSGTLPEAVQLIPSAETCSKISYSVITGYMNSSCEIILSAYTSTRKVVVDNLGNVSVDDTVAGGAFFTPTPTFDPFNTPTPLPQATPTNTPTPTTPIAYTPTPTPQVTNTPTPTPTNIPTPTFTPTPTPAGATCATCTGRNNYLCPGILWNPPYCSSSSGWGTCTLCP